MELVKEMGSSEDVPELASWPCGSKIMLKIQQYLWCWHVVFWKFKKGRKISEKVHSVAMKYFIAYILLKITTIIYTAVLPFVTENRLQSTFSWFLFLVNLCICVMDYPKVFLYFYMLCMLCPLVICSFVGGCIDKCWPCMWEMPRHHGVAGQNQPVLLQRRAESIQQVAETQNQDDRFDRQQRSTSFVPFKRMTTNKAKSNIMKNWIRIFTPSEHNKGEYCCICLEEFEKAEAIIDLKCGIGHIFHPECIEAWSLKNHSWPLCRKDFIEIAKQEPEAIPDEHTNQVLNGEHVTNGALPVLYGEENKSDGRVSA